MKNLDNFNIILYAEDDDGDFVLSSLGYSNE